MKLLLLSNSTNPGEPYLSYPRKNIQNFLGEICDNIVFIPFAAVTFSYDEYEAKVNSSLAEIGVTVKGIHHFDDPVKAVEEAQAIVIGGGNTWKLTRMLHDSGIMQAIRSRVESGAPYIGWSAGSNVASPTLRTTNDMPIIDPKGFETLDLIPFQINPHYLDDHPSNHGGETREMRILEFIEENKDVFVVGLREATMLQFVDGKLSLLGERSARVFKNGVEVKEYTKEDDLSFLLK